MNRRNFLTDFFSQIFFWVATVLFGYSLKDRVVGPLYKESLANGESTDQNMDQRLASMKEKMKDNTITVKIPEDIATLQEAVDFFSATLLSQRIIVSLNLEAGYQPEKGIVVQNMDCGNIHITSEDSVVQVANNFTGSFIEGYHSTLPRLGCLVDMRGLGEAGYSVMDQSKGYIDYNCGIRNAGDRGLYVSENSHVLGRATEFTGCHNRNVWVTRTSSFEGEKGNFSANKGGDNAVYVSRSSYANLLEANVSNAFKNGIASIRSTVNCEGANVSGAAEVGLEVQASSRVSAKFLNAQDCGVCGIRYEDGSSGDIREANASGSSGDGIQIAEATTVNAYGAIANDCGGIGLLVSDGGRVNAREATFKNNKDYDIRTAAGGEIIAKSTATTHGTPSAEDCMPSVFNEVSEDGLIYGTDSPNQ